MSGNDLKAKDIGPCPSCGGMISSGRAIDPSNGKPAEVLLHAMPFCNYFGATEPEQIIADLVAKRVIE